MVTLLRVIEILLYKRGKQKEKGNFNQLNVGNEKDQRNKLQCQNASEIVGTNI